MDERRDQDFWHSRPHSIFWPLLLIALGVFLLLSTLNLVEGSAWEVIVRLWPMLLIVSGLDGLYRRDSYVASVLFIGLGVIFLLSNLGYIELGSWAVFIQLWPVLLVAFGLDLLIGQRGAWSALFGVLIGLGLIVLVVWFTLSQPFALTRSEAQPVSQELEGARQAEIYINPTVGSLELTAADQGDGPLVKGEVRVSRRETIEQSYRVNDGEGVYRLSTEGGSYVYPFMPLGTHSGWALEISPAVPVDLNSTVVVGSHDLNLLGLELTGLEVETVIGSGTIMLPESGDFNGSAQTVIGQLIVRVPQDAAVRFNLDTGLTSASYPDDFIREDDQVSSPEAENADEVMELRLEVPMGGVLIEYY
jgi:hypothetical protein